MWKIYAILVGVMISWGLNVAALKYLIMYIGPITMTSFRILIAGITVFMILFLLKLIRLPTRDEWKLIVLGALLNVVGHHYFLTIGLVSTTGSNAGLILGTGPLLTAISVSLIFRNYPSKVQWIGFFSGLFGVSIIVLASGEIGGASIGDFFIFIAILVQVLSFLVVSRASRTLDPRLMTGYMLVIGATILVIIGLIREPGEIKAFATVPPIFWAVFLASSLVATAIGHMLYNYSVGMVGPSKSAIFINFSTVFSLVGSALFLGEVITLLHLFGLIFIIAGVIFGSGAAEDLWKQRKRRKQPS